MSRRHHRRSFRHHQHFFTVTITSSSCHHCHDHHPSPSSSSPSSSSSSSYNIPATAFLRSKHKLCQTLVAYVRIAPTPRALYTAISTNNTQHPAVRHDITRSHTTHDICAPQADATYQAGPPKRPCQSDNEVSHPLNHRNQQCQSNGEAN